MILCFCWPKVGPGIISEILQYIMEAGRSSSTVKEGMFGDGSKTKPHGLSGCTPDQTRKFVPKKSKQEEAGLVCRADDVVLGGDQVILCYHLEIYLLFSRRNKRNEKNKHG